MKADEQEQEIERTKALEEADDLEARLLLLAADVRQTTAEELQKRREMSVLEARTHVEDVRPIPSTTAEPMDAPKILLGLGVDPRQDPTLVGRRISDNEWAFGAPAELDELENARQREASRGLAGPDGPDDKRNQRRPLRAIGFAFVCMVGVVGMVTIGFAVFSAKQGKAMAPERALLAQSYPLGQRADEVSAWAIQIAAGAVVSSEDEPAEVIPDSSSTTTPKPIESQASWPPTNRGKTVRWPWKSSPSSPALNRKTVRRSPIGAAPIY